jgi:hypothetical protein
VLYSSLYHCSINTLKQAPAIAFSTALFEILQNIFHILSFSFCFFFLTFSLQANPAGLDQVDMATGYGLDFPGNRIPVEARFSSAVEPGPAAHPTSYTIVTVSLSRG